ncbi:IS66 family transposase [Aestuariicella hydrocarbonica]
MFFRYEPTRNRSVPTSLLTAEVSALLVDGYQGYESSCKDYEIAHLGCWAHARRKVTHRSRRTAPVLVVRPL